MRAIKKQTYTLEEYFDLERNSEEKWEFWDGHVWCMSGASIAHERIVSNILFSLRSRLPQECSTFASNVRVKVPIYAPYRYPDLTVVCGKVESDVVSGLEVLLNPQIIFEVLSPTTEAFDRGAKFIYYKSIQSLKEYVLIATERPHVAQFVRRAENEWLNRDFIGLESSLMFPAFGIDIPLSEIYRGIEFPEAEIPNPEVNRVPEKER